MKQYRTVKECLDALARGFIVDAKDNRVPPSVIRALAKKSGKCVERIKHQIHGHIRYEGNREIWWFC